MTSMEISGHQAVTLKDKVVVLTGGASGIGAATVSQLHSLGAKIIFGDVNEDLAKSLIESIVGQSSRSVHPTVHYFRCDVRSHSDNLALFKFAMEKYGRVDHAIANAAVLDQKSWFDPLLGIEGVEQEPDPTVLDVNLKGVLLFTRIACQYLAHANGVKNDKSIVLLSSQAGFHSTVGIPLYQVSKHGIIGLLRCLRANLPAMFNGLRVNAVCPSFVRTPLTREFDTIWVSSGLPVSEAHHIASLIVELCAAGPGSNKKSILGDAGGIDVHWNTEEQGVHGRAIYIEGGNFCVDIESGLLETSPQWLGAEPAARIRKVEDTVSSLQAYTEKGTK